MGDKVKTNFGSVSFKVKLVYFGREFHMENWFF